MIKASVENASPDLLPGDHEPAWYKQPWVWFIIALPVTSIVAGIFMIVTAVTHPDTLVVDDWYKEGRSTNRSMAAENLAADFAIGMSTSFDQDSNTTNLQFVAGRNMVWPDSLLLALRHRTLAEQDQVFVLQHQGDGLYQTTGQLPAGNWHTQVSSEDVSWRLAGPATVSTTGGLSLGTAH